MWTIERFQRMRSILVSMMEFRATMPRFLSFFAKHRTTMDAVTTLVGSCRHSSMTLGVGDIIG